MKNLYEKTGVEEVLQRLEKLQPKAERQWGKMQSAQMLAHCSAAMEVAVGEKFPPRPLFAKLIGWAIKPKYLGEKPFNHNDPTDPSFIITDERDFNKEKTRLTQLIKKFSEGGSAKCTTHPHSFFGPMTPDEWSILMYKHLDHHLRQFGA